MTTARKSRVVTRTHEHAASLRSFLAAFQHTANASTIMTPWALVDFVEGEANGPEAKQHARAMMDDHHYSAVPLVWSGELRGVYVRNGPEDSPRFERALPDHFVSPTIGLLDLLTRMRSIPRFVVAIGSVEQPQGWLTYADFSKRPFRVLLFALLAEVEYLLAAAIDRSFPDGEWAKLLAAMPEFNRASVGELLVRQVEAQHWDVTMPLTTFAEIGHLAAVAGVSKPTQGLLGESERLGQQLKSLSELRNRVAHVVRPIIAGPSQIGSVADQVDLMMGWIDKWSARLQPQGGKEGTQ